MNENILPQIETRVISLLQKSGEVAALRWLKKALRKPDSNIHPLEKMYLIRNRLVAANGWMLFSAPAPEALRSQDATEVKTLDLLTTPANYTGVAIAELNESEKRMLKNFAALNSDGTKQVAAFAVNRKYLIDALGMNAYQERVIVRVMQKTEGSMAQRIIIESCPDRLSSFVTQRDRENQSYAIVMLLDLPEKTTAPRAIEFVSPEPEVQNESK